jgi:hypothetical protein
MVWNMNLTDNPITIAEAPSYSVDIFIAGSRAAATEVLREFCLRGECVTVSEADYVYTGGLEAGVRVGLINYPRFPRTTNQLWERGVEIGRFLIERLHQQSCTVAATDRSAFLSRR